MKQSTITQNNEGEVFFRHANPDERTAKQWKESVFLKTGVLWAESPKQRKDRREAEKQAKVKAKLAKKAEKARLVKEKKKARLAEKARLAKEKKKAKKVKKQK